MAQREQQVGEVMLLGTCVLEGLFPILANLSMCVFPPVLFTALSALLAAAAFACILLWSGGWRRIPFKGFLYACGVAVFVVLASTFIFVGARSTSGINTTLLLQAEILFTFIVSTLFLRETWRVPQLLGAAAILCGDIFILFNGTLVLNHGDLFILLATALFPIGNIFAKRALHLLSSQMLLFLRYAVGGVFLLLLSLLIEGAPPSAESLWAHRSLFLVYTFLILVGSKLFWYGGLKRLPLGRAVAIISSAPAFGLFFAFLFLREIPTLYQFVGFGFSTIGVFLIIAQSRLTRPLSDRGTSPSVYEPI